MKRRIFDISIAILVVLAPYREARADKGEASLHGHVQFGTAKLGGIREAPGQTDRAPFLGIGARATYAPSNWYSYEAALWLGRLGSPVSYTIDTRSGPEIWDWRMAWARADFGVTARLGVRLIPTVYAALGVQKRLAWQGQAGEHTKVMEPYMGRLREQWLAVELVGTLGAGLDYRLDDHWMVGLAVTTQRSVLPEATFQGIAATFRLSYYFYPEGAGP
jgi:hypothetical protein